MKEHEINISLLDVTLKGNLTIPEKAKGLVIFSHGSGSSRFSTRNRMVAELIHQFHIGTLLFDLLTEEEDQIYETRFDIDLLTQRLIATTHWLLQQKNADSLPIAYFGASTGVASALRASANFKNKVKAVVSRGGRPDMALDELHLVTAPTLLIVGGMDFPVITMNEKAMSVLRCTKEFKIIPEPPTYLKNPENYK